MPKILDRLVKQLKDKWKSKSAAFAIATSALQKSWNLKPWTRVATKKWLARWNMTPSQRAKDRASSKSWISKTKYKYNAKTNTATLKKKAPK